VIYVTETGTKPFVNKKISNLQSKRERVKLQTTEMKQKREDKLYNYTETGAPEEFNFAAAEQIYDVLRLLACEKT